MFTILGADGKEYGPVATAKIHEWINGGRANLTTKARRDGETEWKTLGEFAEFAPAAGATPPPAAADVVPTLAPGSAADAVKSAGPVNIKAYADDLIARATPLDVFECITKSFELWKNNFLPLVGVTLLIFFIVFVIRLIPVIGPLAGLVLNGVFWAGLYYYYMGKVRGEPRELGDAFAGFSKAPLPLILASLLSTALIMVVMVPFFLPILGFVIESAVHGGRIPLPHFAGTALLWMLVGMIPLLYLGVAWMFTFLLVIDKGLGPWMAMEVSRRVITKQWFRVFFAVLLGAILTMLGLIGLLFGILLTLPLMVGATVCAYEHLCNPPPKS